MQQHVVDHKVTIAVRRSVAGLYQIKTVEIGAIGNEIIVMVFKTAANDEKMQVVTAAEGAFVHGGDTIGQSNLNE